MAIKITSILKDKNIPNICLLYGSEDYLKRQYKDRLIDAILPERSSINFNVFRNNSGRKEESEGFITEVYSLSRTTPFFSEKRVILCENTGFFKNKFDLIAQVLEELPDFTHLIFVEKEVSKATNAYKLAAKLGFVEEYTMPDDSSLAAWINGRVKKEGKTIDRDALQSFIQRTRTNMDNMDRELFKLLTYTLNNDKITLKDVDDICIVSLEEQVFNIVNAIARRDRASAMREYTILYNLRSNPRSLLALLTNRFTQILNIRKAKSFGMDNGSIAAGLGIKNEYALKKNLETASLFSEKSLEAIVRMSSEYQQKMNTGLLSEQTGIEMFIIKSLKV